MGKLDISIAGELNLDLILYGLPANMDLERELLATDFTVTLGSSSAILAHNLAVLGSSVGFTSKVGDDAFAALALHRLQQSGVDLRPVAARAKSGVTVLLPHGAKRHILTYMGTIAELRFEDLNFEYLSSARHFHLSSLFLQRGLFPRAAELFRRMKRSGLTTSLDTNDDPEDRWRGVEKILPFVDVLLPNQREAMRMTGTTSAEAALRKLGKKVETVVIKRGSKGAMALRGGKIVTSPAVPVPVLDLVGAGDSFDAGFLHQFLRGADLLTCLANGNLCGAFSTTACGGTEAFRDAKALKAFFAKHKGKLSLHSARQA
jgi:sugar/nucleoside kinase (ribokinase family)